MTEKLYSTIKQYDEALKTKESEYNSKKTRLEKERKALINLMEKDSLVKYFKDRHWNVIGFDKSKYFYYIRFPKRGFKNQFSDGSVLIDSLLNRFGLIMTAIIVRKHGKYATLHLRPIKQLVKQYEREQKKNKRSKK